MIRIEGISKKFKEGEVVFLDNLDIKMPKTSEAKKIIGAISKVKGQEKIASRKNAAFLALSVSNENVQKSFQNFGNMEVGKTKDLNPLDLLNYKYLVIADPEKSLKDLEARMK